MSVGCETMMVGCEVAMVGCHSAMLLRILPTPLRSRPTAWRWPFSATILYSALCAATGGLGDGHAAVRCPSHPLRQRRHAARLDEGHRILPVSKMGRTEENEGMNALSSREVDHGISLTAVARQKCGCMHSKLP